jgi:glycosyltransferase involved in cell wall biosynthesis
MLELKNPSKSKIRVAMNWLFEDGPGIHRAVRRLDGRFTTAPSLNRRLQRIYGFPEPLQTLPTPVVIPGEVIKAPTPLVVFIGRWDRRKRPEIFLRLAGDFPSVRFVAVGMAQDRKWEQSLREEFGRQPNLELRNFVDQFESEALSELLSKSWILVNTAIREGVPTSALEAMAHRCAVLSYVNPDNIAGRFGYHAARDDFVEGLRWLLEGDRWREKGLSAQAYVRQHFECGVAVDRHLEIYKRALAAGRSDATDGD